MNRTKTLTQGAMLLAIFGALVLIDRITTFLFTELVVLIAPIIIILYSAMQSFKDGVFLSIGVIIISFLLGNFNTTYLIYVPIGIITGLVYSFGIVKGFDKHLLLFLAVITYLIGEVVSYYVIYPLLGFPVSQMIAEYKLILEQTGSVAGMDYSSIFETAGLSLDKLLPILYIISTMITGALEGLLIHILSIFLMKRFKIKNFGFINLWDLKPNKIVAYGAMIATSSICFRNLFKNETLSYACIVLCVIGAMILIYYGYIFLLIYCKVILRRNISGFIVVLGFIFPAIFIAIICLGFLYGAGPLRKYLENQINILNNKNE